MDNNAEMFELLTKMYSEMQEFKNNIEGKFDKLEGRFDKLEGRLEIVELAVVETSQDVKFIKHKVQETEADVFNIQNKLEIIK